MGRRRVAIGIGVVAVLAAAVILALLLRPTGGALFPTERELAEPSPQAQSRPDLLGSPSGAKQPIKSSGTPSRSADEVRVGPFVDVATGEPVEGLEVLVRASAIQSERSGHGAPEKVERQSDNLGYVMVPVAEHNMVLDSVAAPWHLAPAQSGNPIEGGRILVYRTVTLLVSVEFADLQSAESRPTIAFLVQCPQVHHVRGAVSDTVGESLRENVNGAGLNKWSPNVAMSDMDEYRMEVPRAKDLHIVAVASGGSLRKPWLRAHAPIPSPAPDSGDPVRVRLVLQHGIIIEGSVRDALGKPVAGATVNLIGIGTGDQEAFETAQLQNVSAGLHTDAGGKTSLLMLDTTRSDASGQFAVPLALRDLRIRLSVSAHRAMTARIDLGSATDPRGSVSVSLADAGPPRYAVLSAGSARIRSTEVVLEDVTERSLINTAWRSRTDADGRIDTSSLEVGRKYEICVGVVDGRQPHRGEIVWDGRSEIDMGRIEIRPR